MVEFWTSTSLPPEVCVRLVEVAFAHPAVREARPVLLCVPVHDSEVLTKARKHLGDARSHVAPA